MNAAAVAGVGVVAAILSVMLRRYHPEYAVAVSLCAGAVLLLMLLSGLSPILGRIGELVSVSGMPREYGTILIKSLGVCYLTQLACDCCRDAGESAMASRIELAGKTSMVLIALPLFEAITSTAVGMIKG